MSGHFEKLISGITKQLKLVFGSSEQGVYIYFDDTHKVCNKKFSSMLGYKSPEEWAKVNENIPAAFVAEKSIMTLIKTYRRAMEKRVGSNIKITWKQKSGGVVNTNVILVPIAYENHLMALHFVSKSK